jgi:hypothetical protein
MHIAPDRREHERTPFAAAVRVRVLSSSDVPGLRDEQIECSAEDISAGGLRLRLNEHLVAGSRLELLIRTSPLPAGAFLFEGIVRWVETVDGTCCLGVELREMPDEQAAKWWTTIHHCVGVAPSG